MPIINPKSFIERIADTVHSAATSKIIFGEPIESDGVVIIPVSRMRYGFGAGFGRKKNGGEKDKVGRGAGGGVDAQPVGYIEIKDGNAIFKTISKPISLPVVILATGLASIFVFKGLANLFRK